MKNIYNKTIGDVNKWGQSQIKCNLFWSHLKFKYF
jgi:hypothetical protein